MNNQIELYVNKKFDIMKIIKMVLKRKGWGENYTLYSTPTHEVIANMVSYDFEGRYATFRIRVNQKGGSGYYSNALDIYTNREDYTVQFINQLLLKRIVTTLNDYRKSIFEKEASDLYPYIYRYEKDDEEWIEQFGLEEKINKVKALDIDDDELEEMIDSIISKAVDKYEDKTVYKPRDKYVKTMVESNKEPQILALIDEITIELNKENK